MGLLWNIIAFCSGNLLCECIYCLVHCRPAYMDEYERVEVDLQKQYAVYVEKHCHLSYLEHQLDLVNQAEHHQHEVYTCYIISLLREKAL